MTIPLASLKSLIRIVTAASGWEKKNKISKATICTPLTIDLQGGGPTQKKEGAIKQNKFFLFYITSTIDHHPSTTANFWTTFPAVHGAREVMLR